MPEQLTTTATAAAVAETFGPAPATPKDLRTGKALTATELLKQVRAAATELQVAGNKRISNLVRDFLALPFTVGSGIFKQARKDAGDDKSTLVRLSEANAIFTSVSMAKVPAGNYDGMGWGPAVRAAREALKTAGITVAGNERLTDEQKAANKAKATAREVSESSADRIAAEALALGRDLTADEVATIMAEERAKVGLKAASNAFPDALLNIGKAFDSLAKDLDTLAYHRENDTTLWQTLPGDIRDCFAGMLDMRREVIGAALEIAAVRENAKEQRAHERAEKKLEAAQAEVGKNIRRADRKAA